MHTKYLCATEESITFPGSCFQDQGTYFTSQEADKKLPNKVKFPSGQFQFSSLMCYRRGMHTITFGSSLSSNTVNSSFYCTTQFFFQAATYQTWHSCLLHGCPGFWTAIEKLTKILSVSLWDHIVDRCDHWTYPSINLRKKNIILISHSLAFYFNP